MHRPVRMAIPLLAVSAAMATTAVISGPALVDHLRESRIRARGVVVPAVITLVADDGTRVDGNPVLELTVRVLRPSGPRTLARLRAVVPEAVAGDLAAGQVVRVRFDPEDPGRVVLARPPSR